MNSWPPTLDDQDRFLSHLRFGVEFTESHMYGRTISHWHVIWNLLEYALDMVDRLPDQERQWLTSGTRSIGWSNSGMTRLELDIIERIRVVSGIKPMEGVASYQPQKDDHERMLDVLSWFRWCNELRRGDRLRRAAIALARGGDTQLVNEIYSNGRTRSRTAVVDIRKRVIQQIRVGLERDCGIIMVGDYEFAPIPLTKKE